MSLGNSIKKYSLRHVQCHHGGLHTGEVMNLVCVDSSCSHRGLICPICRMQHHETHQILPIKTFLEHIRSMFTQSENTNQLNNLSDYLRALENKKKEIISNLRAEVAKLAATFKDLQEKIEDNFLSVRRNVLIQSSITTKLPTLLTLLTEDNVNKDADSIRDQFKKYTELLKYEENKLKVSDKAKALVQNYSSLPIKLQELLSTHSSEFSKKLEGLPKLFEEREKAGLSEQPGANSYTFSTQNKYFDIVLEENNKLAKASEYLEEAGYIFVNENKGGKKQKIVLEIVSNSSECVSVGFGDVDEFRNSCSFINDRTMDDKTELYEFYYSTGYKKNIDYSDSEEQPQSPDPIGPPFITGDIIEIQYDGTTITYFNRTSNDKKTRTPTFSEKTKENLQFLIGLGQGDSVRILDQ